MSRAIAAIALTNLKAVPQRWGASLVVVLGMAGVVGVMVALLAMADGFRETFRAAGRPDRAIVMASEQDNGMASSITREQLPIVLDLPGFRRDAEGKPLVVAQKFMSSELSERKTGTLVGAVLRGVSGQVWKVFPEIRIVEGRAFTPGRREALVGRAAQKEFEGLELGAEAALANGKWAIVGVFEAPGTIFESELIGDVEMVFPGYSITGQYSSAVGVLESEGALAQLQAAIKGNPQLKNAAMRETDYYTAVSNNLGGPMVAFGYAVAAIMALGALFAATNTMYAAVKTRSREIATLRALGFGGLPVVCSVLLESLVLCVAGALLGGAAAYLAFNGYTISTVGNGDNLQQMVFGFRVTPALLGQGAAAALLVGLLGGLLPAVRAARLPVAEALRGA
ncbi:MAG TPA: ABC transporter permease [Candidatus Binatia bacterium]|nr:ABC transporter permease [Candidatus Binatia bacterium]